MSDSTDEFAERIVERFRFHPATGTTGPMHDHVRELYQNLARHLATDLPNSRETSLALTALEESMHWSNASVALHGVGLPEPN